MRVTAFNLPQTVSIAFLVISGEYGDGEERKRKLAKDGYDATKIQKCVNNLLPILKEFDD